MLTDTLEQDAAIAANNVHFKNAMTMAVDYTPVFKPTVGEEMLPKHLRCILALLQAGASLTQTQHSRVLRALEHFKPFSHVPVCSSCMPASIEKAGV